MSNPFFSLIINRLMQDNALIIIKMEITAKIGSMIAKSKSSLKNESSLTQKKEFPDKFDQKDKLIGNKQINKEDKKITKFQEKIQKCLRLILSSEIETAIEILKQIIGENDLLEHFEFVGLGNNSNWKSSGLQEPLEWIKSLNMNLKLSRNPFDLLSLCFMIQLEKKKVKVSEIAEVYDKFDSIVHQKHELFMGLGNAYYNNGQILKAEGEYFNALLKKKTQKVYEYLACIKGEWFQLQEQALQYSEKCLKFNSENHRALIIKLRFENDEGKSEIILNQLSLQNNLSCQILLLKVDFVESQLQKNQILNKIIEENPKCIEAYVKKAEIMTETDSGQSRKLIQKALEINPESSLALHSLALIQFLSQNVDEERKILKELLKMNPFYFRSIKLLAESYEEDEEQNMKKSLYEEYARLNPYDSNILQELGKIYESMEDWEQAKKCFNKVLEMNPDSEQDLIHMGRCFQNEEDFENAIHYYIKAYQLGFSPNASFGLANCYEEIQNREEATYWAKKCIEDGGDQQNKVYYLMGDLCLIDLDVYGAMGWYLKRTCITKQIDTEYIMEELVNLLPDINLATASLLQIAKQADEQEENVILALQIAELFIELGEDQYAKICYKKIRELIPEHQVEGHELQEYLKKVYELEEISEEESES